MHQSAIVLVRCVPGSSLLPPPYWKARRPWELGCKVMTSRHVPLDRRISDFRFPISNFWFLISVFRFLISDFWFPISDFRFPISDFRFPISGFGFRISDFWFLKSRFLISVFGNQKYLPSISGFWFMKFRKRIRRKASWLETIKKRLVWLTDEFLREHEVQQLDLYSIFKHGKW